MEKADRKNILKKLIDIIMTLLLLCLMAYQVTEESLHEWFGIAMTAVLILHHILDIVIHRFISDAASPKSGRILSFFIKRFLFHEQEDGLCPAAGKIPDPDKRIFRRWVSDFYFRACTEADRREKSCYNKYNSVFIHVPFFHIRKLSDKCYFSVEIISKLLYYLVCVLMVNIKSHYATVAQSV